MVSVCEVVEGCKRGGGLCGAWCMVHGAWCMVHGAWCRASSVVHKRQTISERESECRAAGSAHLVRDARAPELRGSKGV